MITEEFRKAMWRPGQSGNPKGKKKGSRHLLSESFLKDLLNDFNEHGKEAIEDVRINDTSTYIKVVASCVNKLPDEESKDNAVNRLLDAIPDENLADFADGVRLLAAAYRNRKEAAETGLTARPVEVH